VHGRVHALVENGKDVGRNNAVHEHAEPETDGSSAYRSDSTVLIPIQYVMPDPMTVVAKPTLS
jgi:hypothetical protein